MPVHPDDLNRIADIPEEKLHPEFRKKMDMLISTILATAHEKTIFSEKYPM